MFAARCAGVSLAIFFLLYVGVSVFISRGWTLLWRIFRPRSSQTSADLLFALRMSPFAVSLFITFLFTLPSFLLLEPRSTDESVGIAPIALATCCLAALAIGILRTCTARKRSARIMENWLESSTLLDSTGPVPVFRIGNEQPSFTVSGVCAPKVFVSETAVANLTMPELRAALRHEMAHVRRYDNLKKMILKLAIFPGLTAVEQAWLEQTEMAADDAAVFSRTDALDLAGALIKISRLPSTHSGPELSLALLHTSTGLSRRVERLFNWEAPQEHRWTRWYLLPAVAMAVLGLFTSYNSILLQIHVATEWLVR